MPVLPDKNEQPRYSVIRNKVGEMANTERVEKRGSAATVRACDLCRKRKRRCLWTSGSVGCTPCVTLNETCTTTHVRKQRAKPQRGYINRVAEYETRINRLESLLQASNAAQPQFQDQPLQPAADPAGPATDWVTKLRHELPSVPRPDFPELEALYGETLFAAHSLLPSSDEINGPEFASSTSTNVFTSDDLATMALDNTEPSTDFQEDIAFFHNPHEPNVLFKSDTWIPPPLPLEPACDGYLPPPELGTTLLSEFLVDFNTAYPLYRPHVIADHLRVCYSGASDGSAVAWCSAYVVFGLAYMLRGSSATATKQDNELARYYLARNYISLNRLLLSSPSLGLVQCLIGVALLVQSTPCGRNVPDGHFLSTSLRVAQSMAYHDDESDLSDKDRDVEQERRVFWLGFINDTSTSMLSGSPTTQRREDIVAPKPDENPADSLGAVIAAEGHWKVNIFSLRLNLALLQAEAIEQVLSAKARNTAPLDIDAAATIVLSRLKSFHNHELFNLSPDQLFQLLYRSDVAHTVSLEASYFATVYRLHAFMALDKNSRINPFTADALRRLSAMKEQKSSLEAKRLLSLLPIAPRGDVGLYWMEHRSLVAALVTVLAHHVNNPTEPAPTKDEQRGYNELIADLGTLVERSVASSDCFMAQARALCMELSARLETSLRIELLQKSATHQDKLTMSAS
ncbi:hypothetical protein HBH95_059100 [Parastagonospora nodorum]|nr:hypothetical protein HBI74_241880 [Parastagonospora nodorum]KAH5082073.1 hypothetical protein HBH95_059100 [Parastagonospora nodorum]KAH6229563.1 hypothetical protein HBI53_032470 [Parastagonospora nodorum]